VLGDIVHYPPWENCVMSVGLLVEHDVSFPFAFLIIVSTVVQYNLQSCVAFSWQRSVVCLYYSE